MNIDGSEPQINKARDRRTALRNRLGPASSTSPALEASVQLLQGLACERSEASPPVEHARDGA